MGLNEHQRGHETPKTLFNALRLSPPRGVLVHVSPCFCRVAALGNSRISGQRSRDRPRWPSLGEKSASARRNSCRRYPFAPFPTRFALFLTCRNPGKHSHFGPTLKRSPTLGHTFCQETQNRPAIRKPPSGIFARRHAISSQKFPAVAVSPPPVLPARHACKYSSSA